MRVSFCAADAEILPTSFSLQEAPVHEVQRSSYQNTHFKHSVNGESMKITCYHTDLKTLTTLKSYILPVKSKKAIDQIV